LKVTLVPEQIFVSEAETATEGVTGALTLMETGNEVTDVGVAQVSVDVMIQVITSPSFKDAFE